MVGVGLVVVVYCCWVRVLLVGLWFVGLFFEVRVIVKVIVVFF